MELNAKKKVFERQTYSLLEWLGDVGGLYDGELLIGRFIVGPLADFAVSSALLTKIFSLAPRNKTSKTKKTSSRRV